MSESQMLVYALSVAGALLLVIWGLLRQESKRYELALEKKASTEALAEVKELHREEIRELRAQFREQLAEIHRRQDREIDALQGQISQVQVSVSELRKEMLAANANLSQNMQQLIAIVRDRTQS